MSVLSILNLVLQFGLSTKVDDAQYLAYSGPSEEDVIELDNTDFDQTILSSQEAWFVDFHAPWCGHCKELRPIWAQLATKFRGRARFAKLAASLNRQFDDRYEIKGYPTVNFIPPGPKNQNLHVKHEGSRTLSSLSDWVEQMLDQSKGFLFKQLTSKQVYDQYCGTRTGICLIVFLPNIRDSSNIQRQMYIQTVKDVMNNHRDKPYNFLWTQDGDHPQLQEMFQITTGFPAVLLINPIKKMTGKMTAAFTSVNLDSYLKHAIRRGRFGNYNSELPINEVPEWDPQSSANNQIKNEQM